MKKWLLFATSLLSGAGFAFGQNGQVQVGNTPPGSASLNSTSPQAFQGQITAPQIGNTYQADGFPSSCTIGGNPYTTQLDCAFQTAKAYAIATSTVPLLQMTAKVYQTCAGLDMGNATANKRTVSCAMYSSPDSAWLGLNTANE